MENALEPEPGSPVSDLVWIDAVADRFEKAWRESSRDPGKWPDLEAFCAEVNAKDRMRLLAELVPLDAEYRCKLSSTTVRWQDYLKRFPELEHLEETLQSDLTVWISKVNVRYIATANQVSPPATMPHSPAKNDAMGMCPGKQVDQYFIITELGRGGQAVTYLAQDRGLNRTVVLKLGLQSGPPGSGSGSLAHEGKLLASLEHPNLVRVYGLGAWEGRPYLAMEHVKGRTLEQYQQEVHPNPTQSAKLIAAIARGLAEAHAHGIHHLDLTPRNVLIDPAGVPKIIDFGLSRLRQIWAEDAATPGMIRGTPGFLTPEQATGELQNRLGPKTDVFGLGGLLYYLLHGRPPYQGTTEEVLKKAAGADIEFNDVVRTTALRRTLESICRQALRLKPEDRPSAEEFAQRLEAAIRAPRWPWLASAAAIFLACVTIGWLAGKHGSEPAPISETRSASMGVRVWKGNEDVRDLVRALPIQTGDHVQLFGRVPAGMHGAFFSIDSEGRIKLVKQFAAQDKEREVAYPETQSAAIKGLPGTELFLLCARRSKPVSLEEITRAWPDGTWPAIPPATSLRLKADHVVFEGEIVRGLDEPDGPAHPELLVERRLEAFRQRLLEVADVFGGVAFGHW